MKLKSNDRRIHTLMMAFALTLSLNIHPANAETVLSRQTSEGDALNLPIYSWTDSSVPTKAIIFAIHGVTLYSGNFDEPAKHLASEGYPVYAMDMRGFGRWQSESRKFAGDTGIHYTQSQQDLEIVLKKLRAEHPDTRLYVLGESIGANLALWLASKDPQLMDGVILSSPCIKACFHARPRLVVDTFRGLIHPNTRHSTKPYIKDYLSEDRRVTTAYFADPLVVHKLSPVEMFKSLKTNTRALLAVKNIPQELPILIVAGKRDKIYNATAIPQFAEHLGSSNKTIVIEEKKGHILLETKFVEPEVLSVIDNWLTKAVSDPEPIAEQPNDKISSAH